MVISHRVKESVSSVQCNYETILHPTWIKALGRTLESDYMSDLQCFIRETYRKSTSIYPRNPDDIFKAYRLTPFNQVKVVIFADNPYPSAHSNGLAFGSFKACRGLTKHPQSLAIEQCLNPDNIHPIEEFNPTLRTWAEQGVLLLNTALITDKEQSPKYEIASRNFIRETIKTLVKVNVDLVFVFTSQKQVQALAQYVDLDFNHMMVYKGIDSDSSIFEDINTVLEQETHKVNVIQW